ncbi:MAG: DUF2889 domain-containing protein [Betaproteobacteria bacterium]|nr:DUF2889 domain-containing protein [Betaproteobacteria bacterium]
MPLSDPAPRKLIHNRSIECRGYQREDGLWDIEARLLDTKTFEHIRSSEREEVLSKPSRAARARCASPPASASSATGMTACGDITPNFKALKGVTIGPGWRRKTLELLGGIKGCTHLVELLGPVATTAFQATGRAREARAAGKPLTKKPYQLNACHMYKDDGPAVLKRWPQFYKNAGVARPDTAR